jgi:hypothetical protein
MILTAVVAIAILAYIIVPLATSGDSMEVVEIDVKSKSPDLNDIKNDDAAKIAVKKG